MLLVLLELFFEKWDQSMTWKDAENLCKKWNGHFALKGIMSVDDQKKQSISVALE